MKADAAKKPVPIRLPESTKEAVKYAGQMLDGWGDQQVMRLAMQIGLKVLADVDYDVDGILAKAGLARMENGADANSAPDKAKKRRVSKPEKLADLGPITSQESQGHAASSGE